MSADVKKYAKLVDGHGMVYFDDCASISLLAFCAQVAKATGTACPTLERWSNTYNDYIPVTNENIECEMKVKIIVPPPKPIADDMSVPPNLLAEAAKFRMGNDVEFVLVNTKRGSIAFCFACGSKILCSSNKLDNFQNGHLDSSKHKNASQGH